MRKITKENRMFQSFCLSKWYVFCMLCLFRIEKKIVYTFFFLLLHTTYCPFFSRLHFLFFLYFFYFIFIRSNFYFFILYLLAYRFDFLFTLCIQWQYYFVVPFFFSNGLSFSHCVAETFSSSPPSCNTLPMYIYFGTYSLARYVRFFFSQCFFFLLSFQALTSSHHNFYEQIRFLFGLFRWRWIWHSTLWSMEMMTATVHVTQYALIENMKKNEIKKKKAKRAKDDENEILCALSVYDDVRFGREQKRWQWIDKKHKSKRVNAKLKKMTLFISLWTKNTKSIFCFLFRFFFLCVSFLLVCVCSVVTYLCWCNIIHFEINIVYRYYTPMITFIGECK